MLPPIEIVYTVIGTISMLIYICLIAALLHFRRKKENEYQSSFFAIFISLGIADIAERINTQFNSDLLTDPSLQNFYLTIGNANGHFLAKLGMFLLKFLDFAQFGGHLLVAINRYTAMSFPMKHDKIWSKRTLIFAISMQWTISFALTFYLFFIDSSFNIQYDYVALYIDFNESPIANEVSNLLFGVVTFIVCTACLILNLLAYKNYRKSTKIQSSQQIHKQNNNKSRFELQLFMFGIAIFFIMIPISIIQVLMAIAVMTENWTLLNAINPQWPWITQLTCDANPFLLLITSGMLRKRIRRMFNAKNVIKVGTTAVSTNSNQQKIDTFHK